MNDNGSILVHDYIKQYDEYSKKYEKVVILMQVGSFYEIYGKKKEGSNDIHPNISIISDVLNIILVQRKSDESNTYLCGFTASALTKYQNILLSHGYTCVIIEENGTLKKKKVRVVTNIVSPGTNVNTEQDINNLVCLYIQNEAYSLSSIDVTLGTGLTFETVNIEDVYRFIKYQSPSEIVIYNTGNNESKQHICGLLDISPDIVQYYTTIDESYFKVGYQTELLKKAGFGDTLLSPIEYINLERHPISLISYILCIQFIYEHNENIIKELKKPEFWDATLSLEKNLLLMNNSLEDLDIISNKLIRTRNSSLYDLFNDCATVLGRRYLKQRLIKPYNDNTINLINNSYSNINEMTIGSKYLDAHSKLNGVYDLERLHRKLKLGTMNYMDFKKLYQSYIKINSITQTFSWVSKPDVNSIIKFIDNKIDTCGSAGASSPLLINIKKGVNEKVDFLNENINKIINEFKKIANELSELVGVEGSVKLVEPLNYIKSYNEGGTTIANEFYYLTTTNIRARVIKEKIKDTMNSYSFKQTGSGTRITNDYIDKNNSKILGYYQELVSVSKLIFKEILNEISEAGDKNQFNLIEEYTSTVDFYSSSAKVSIENGYTRPKIFDSDSKGSFVDIKGIRHPLIERINSGTKFIPNDVSLNDAENGNLIFSTNYGGKSTLLRSLGMNIILAQAGLYVAAKEFNYYPFKMLIARIQSSDNIFKSQSLFTSQMTEIRPIIKNSNLGDKVLVLTDEMCNSTETVSAISLLAAILVNLTKNNVRYMFSTHYHDITNINEIKSLNTLKYYHFKLCLDPTGKIIYERKLHPGVGDTLYGIEIAKSLDLGTQFINHALKIRKEILKQPTQFMSTKKSKYNSKKYIDCCEGCGATSNLHTHHIEHQQSADSNNIINSTFHKNTLHNLKTLCEDCHNREHH